MKDEMYKPGFDGERMSPRLVGREKETFLLAKRALVDRIHSAVMTLSVQPPAARLGVGSGSPAYLQEFSDRVGEEAKAAEIRRWEPTAAQVTDMVPALRLLDGLLPCYHKVVYLRALDEWVRSQGEPGPWPWPKIGERFGMSDRWAEDAYSAAIIQGARRAGVLPKAPQDHAIVVVAVWLDRGWLSQISTSADPRQECANLRSKSPVRIEEAFAIWTAGKLQARRIADEVKLSRRGALDHASWFKVHPEVISTELIARAQSMNAAWYMEDFDVNRLKAA